MPWSICFGEDIGQYVSMIGYINGGTFNYSCGRHIESFYLSEDRRFVRNMLIFCEIYGIIVKYMEQTSIYEDCAK